jgi:hypothetical protein
MFNIPLLHSRRPLVDVFPASQVPRSVWRWSSGRSGSTTGDSQYSDRVECHRLVSGQQHNDMHRADLFVRMHCRGSVHVGKLDRPNLRRQEGRRHRPWTARVDRFRQGHQAQEEQVCQSRRCQEEGIAKGIDAVIVGCCYIHTCGHSRSQPVIYSSIGSSRLRNRFSNTLDPYDFNCWTSLSRWAFFAWIRSRPSSRSSLSFPASSNSSTSSPVASSTCSSHSSKNFSPHPSS